MMNLDFLQYYFEMQTSAVKAYIYFILVLKSLFESL